jgi:hypothetical protein
LPSLQLVPSAALGFEQTPEDGSQAPAAWHWSDAAQTTWLPAAQMPAWQVSFRSQALPSLHDVPLAAAGFEHAPVVELQLPAV